MVLEIHYNNCKTHKTSIDTWFKLTFNNSIILTIINISSSRITCFISYTLTRRHTTSFQSRYDVVVCLQGIQGNSLIIDQKLHHVKYYVRKQSKMSTFHGYVHMRYWSQSWHLFSHSIMVLKTMKLLVILLQVNPAGNYMFKVNNRNTRKRCEICLKLTIKTPERRFTPFSTVSIVNFEQVNAGWESSSKL